MHSFKQINQRIYLRVCLINSLYEYLCSFFTRFPATNYWYFFIFFTFSLPTLLFLFLQQSLPLFHYLSSTSFRHYNHPTQQKSRHALTTSINRRLSALPSSSLSSSSLLLYAISCSFSRPRFHCPCFHRCRCLSRLSFHSIC